MPLPTDEKLVETADNLVKTMRSASSTPSSIRPAHAHGRLTRGTFTPTANAGKISNAPHLTNPSTPIVARFSSSTGVVEISDTDPRANPRGLAVRFLLSEDGHKHTDIIAHSTPSFPMRTGEGFLELLGAIRNGTVGQFLEENPSAAAFVKAPKPSPTSFATEKYYGVNAFKLVSEDGKGTFVRYRFEPEAGLSSLSAEEVKTRSESYLFDELPERLTRGPVGFRLLVQLAGENDRTDDATKLWPEERKVVELGTLKVDSIVEDEKSDKEQQKRIIFDPIPRVDGVEASDDPLLDMRAAVYLISGKERREAPLE